MRFFRWVKSLFKKKHVEHKPVTVPHRIVIQREVVLEASTLYQTIGSRGLDLVVEFEGFYPAPYKDVAGISTIGIGTIIYKGGHKVTMNDDSITRERANLELRYELEQKAKILNGYVKAYGLELESWEYDALISFAYNLGTGYFRTGKTMGNALASGNRRRIADAFLIYNKARVGRFRRLKAIRGLTRRRVAERKLFLNQQ